jgi:hypothetical protein
MTSFLPDRAAAEGDPSWGLTGASGLSSVCPAINGGTVL